MPAPTFLDSGLPTRVTVPATYDGITPLPLLFVLPATNGGWEYGSLRVDPPTSKSGDFLRLRAAMDLVVGLTACSAYASNGGSFKPSHSEIER